MMLDGLHAEPCNVRKVHFEQDKRESVVDIYVSSESLRVFDTPWVEDASPSSEGPAGALYRASIVSETAPLKRSPDRGSSVFLVLLCLLLLIGIICLAVKMNKDKSYWQIERTQLNTLIEELRTVEKINRTCLNGGK
ncbi:uncharacterized protein [Nothobranchius furzeri]|uniref:Uncharacterized protein n=2 Tax=Nothobranchius furzeri TaxID=105023 RepID=A0A1A8AA86_NOTFU